MRMPATWQQAAMCHATPEMTAVTLLCACAFFLQGDITEDDHEQEQLVLCALILITALHTLMAAGLSNSDWKLDNLMVNELHQVLMIDYGTNLQRAAGLNAIGRADVAYTADNCSPEATCGAHLGVPDFRCAADRASRFCSRWRHASLPPDRNTASSASFALLSVQDMLVMLKCSDRIIQP